MKIFITFLVVFIGSSVLTYYFLTSRAVKIGQIKVLSVSDINEITITPSLLPTNLPTPTITLSPTLTPTPTSIPTPASTPTPTITPTPLPFPMLYHEVDNLLKRFSGEYSVDYNLLRKIAECESDFNSSAVNGPYAGLFQFNKTSWISNRTEMGQDTNPDFRFSAEESTKTAAYLISRGRVHLWPNCID